MGFLRFLFTLIPIALTIISIILSALTFVGQIKNNATLDRINLINFDLQNVSTSTLFGTTSLDDISLSTLGLSEYYSLGLWNYCEGTYDSDNNVNVTFCSKPKAMFYIDPSSVLEDLSGISGVTIDLPSDLESLLTKYKGIQKAIFITLIVGIALSFVVLVLGVLSLGVSCFCLISVIGALATICLLFSVAAATGVYIYTRNQINGDLSSYGIKASLSIAYYGLGYSGAVALIIAIVFFVVLSICGGLATFGRYGRTPVQQYPPQKGPEQQVLMEYAGHRP